MKKYLGLLVALLLCAVLLSGCSDGATKGEYFTYIVETDGTATITGYIGNERAVVIPKKIDGHKICAIADNAFASNSLITTVTIQKGVQSIGASAFSNCENLSEVILPETVEFIGAYAFGQTKITSITIPEGIHWISIGTFAYCSRLKEVNLPDSIAYIDREAFYSCESLKEIIIPDSVYSIGRSAFSYCESLAKITMPAKINSDYLSFAEIGEYAFANCGSLREFTVPEGVHTIGGGAFMCFQVSSSLEEITIPASVTLIDEDRSNGRYGNAFYGCDLKRINVKEGSYAAEYFKNHKGLTFY